MSASNIHAQSASVNHLFAQILDLLVDLDARQVAADASDKFDLWKAHSGSDQPPESSSSLEARLEGASYLGNNISNLLKSIEEALKDVTIIMGAPEKNREEPRDQDEKEFEDIKRGDEVEDLLGIASDAIGNLLKLSFLVRQSTVQDRFTGASGHNFEPSLNSSDTEYMKKRFPKLNKPESRLLLQRLGRAIAIRRQTLQYYQEHRPQAAEVLGSETPDILSLTDASVDVPSEVARSDDSPSKMDAAQDTLARLTLGMTSPDHNILSLPTLNKIERRKQDEDLFNCPLCATVVPLESEGAWNSHAHDDLKSYICCFGECDFKMFGNETAWFDHELKHHRRRWICVICEQGSFKELEEFSNHLAKGHSGLILSDKAAEALKDASQSPIDNVSTKECPFCDDWDPRSKIAAARSSQKSKAREIQEGIAFVPTTIFRRHVAIHMEQLALFSIPQGILNPIKPFTGITGAHEPHSMRQGLASAAGDSGSPRTVTLRVMIAGGGGFANILARQLSTTAHPVVVLSRRAHPELESYGCQVTTVDYGDLETLQFTLRGVDLLISTICGPEQINLIDAARRARVGCFVPSEFEGPLSRRPTDDPIERGSSIALDFLERCAASRSRPMQFTVFSCGLFYERFCPGGLASLNLGSSFGTQFPSGDILDIAAGIAEIPVTDSRGRQVHVTMTSVFDVAIFVTSAIELGIENWPREFKMRGAHCSTQQLVEITQQAIGTELEVFSRPYKQLHDWLHYHNSMQNSATARKMAHLIQVANGRYSFTEANLNTLVDVTPVGFRTWLQSTWG